MSTRITVLQSKSEVKGLREKDKLHYAVRKRSLLTALSGVKNPPTPSV